MPIRLNLLAEAQAIEDMRRRDPVKRVVWMAGLMIGAMLVWASSLLVLAMIANKNIGHVEALIASKAAKYKVVTDNRQRMVEANAKLAALNALATNRFLNGTLLNALQQSTVDDVQLSQLKVDQTYALVEAIKGRTNGSKVTPGTPASVTEKISLTINGSDTSASPGDQVTKFKEALAANPYFRDHLAGGNPVNLKNLSAPQISPESGRAMVSFVLECRYPENKR